MDTEVVFCGLLVFRICKSTLAIELERRLFDSGYNVYVLDGDNVRAGLNADLGFSPRDRTENISVSAKLPP